MKYDDALFKDRRGRSVSVSDILKEVYSSSEETKDEITTLVTQLSKTQYTAAEALALLPHINELMSAKIKNNDILVKLINAITRGAPKENSNTPEFTLPEEERLQLLEVAKEMSDLSRRRQ